MVVLSAVYTKRAIDKRLASVNVQEEVHVEEQHFLMEPGGGEDGDEEAAGAAASSSRAPAGVVISVEAPRLIVRRSSSAGEMMHSNKQPQQQALSRPLSGGAAASSSSWGARMAHTLGFGAGSSTRKLKEEREGDDCLSSVPLQQPQHETSNRGGGGQR